MWLEILVVVGILVLGFLVTNWFTGRMYYKCSGCKTLNAKRREKCRMCGHSLVDNAE